MATCDMGFDHDEAAVIPDPEPVVTVDPGPNENDVKIAEIDAAASIEREKIWTEQQAIALEADREELRGELRGMREVLDRLVPPVPEAQPEPVVVPVPAAEPADPVGGPPEVKPPKSEKKGSGWWDNYS